MCIKTPRLTQPKKGSKKWSDSQVGQHDNDHIAYQVLIGLKISVASSTHLEAYKQVLFVYFVLRVWYLFCIRVDIVSLGFSRSWRKCDEAGLTSKPCQLETHPLTAGAWARTSVSVSQAESLCFKLWLLNKNWSISCEGHRFSTMDNC